MVEEVPDGKKASGKTTQEGHHAGSPPLTAEPPLRLMQAPHGDFEPGFVIYVSSASRTSPQVFPTIDFKISRAQAPLAPLDDKADLDLRRRL